MGPPMNLITLTADEDQGDWRAEAELRVEPDGSINIILKRLWRVDGVEPDDLSEQAEQPEPYRH